ncbi:Low affinity sulfate transporter [Parasponia andersonii]|uniref:Low affinity sulfate transporter n=1 Tax=Parasponia andersonii TaxID=3476 RepID=A0A2P5CW91_PARAD|nr:Low affinity sulfate transporter [Parasponia andersonii]
MEYKCCSTTCICSCGDFKRHVIGLQQLKGLFGINHFTTKTNIITVIKAVSRSFVDNNIYIFSSPSIFVVLILSYDMESLQFYPGIILSDLHILVSKFLGRRSKKLFWLQTLAPFLCFMLSTLVVFLFTSGQDHGIDIVLKQIKAGLNQSSVDQLQFHGPYIGEVAKIGLVLALIGLVEATAVGRSFASMKVYHLDANREMVALGLMNILGSLTSCYVATGSFSRTAVNFSSGSETLASSNIVTSLTLWTRFVYYIPKAILSSIILSALPGLIDLNGAYNVWKVDKLDFLAFLATFLGLLFSGVETVKPGMEPLGRIPGTDTFCDVTQYSIAVNVPGFLIVRVKSAWLCFANSNAVRERD